MSHRYSREEKKKWVSASNQAKRKPPVQIPAADTTALIEENKFTLIGRVTNPSVQNTKALMIRDISLPAGEIIQVEFAYDKLEKHCFRCFSLTHEKDDCPLAGNTREQDRSPRHLGISQSNTMARLDGKRKKYEDRRREKAPYIPKYRNHPSRSQEDMSEQRNNARYQLNYSPVTSEFRRGREAPSQDRIFSRNPEDRTDSRSNLRNADLQSAEPPRRRSDRDRQGTRSDNINNDRRAHSHESGSKTVQSPVLALIIPHSSDLRRSLPQREDVEGSGGQLSAERRPTKERLRPPTIPHTSDLRRSLTNRMADEMTGGQGSADRPPAKERLSLPSNGKAKIGQQVNSTGSSRLQDIEIQYLEEIMEPQQVENNSHPSGSRPPGAPVSSPYERSPIRTLSEDRRHVSLRLGPLPESSQSDVPIQARLSGGPEIITRSVAKRKAGTSPQRKRINSSTPHGVSMKKRRVTKPQ
ncbi:hypothetical protein HID58_063651, partial [Brassica napus]